MLRLFTPTLPDDGIACTTFEGDLILASLVLKIRLKKRVPLLARMMRVTPRSSLIFDHMQLFDLVDVSEREDLLQVRFATRSALEGVGVLRSGSLWLSSWNRKVQDIRGKDTALRLLYTTPLS